MRCQIWRHEWACGVKDAQKLSGKTMCSWEISIASHASFRIIWSVFGLWWNWNHCMRMSLPALLAEICSPEIAGIPGSFLDLSWLKLVIFDHISTFRWTFTNPALFGGLKLGVISELKTSLVRVGMGNRLRRISSESSKRNSVIVGDCWWFLVDANHRSEVIANYQQNSGSWCPVWVQVSLMLLVVEELVGCASPFLDRDSTLICSCFKSTQHSTDQKIAVLCCSFSERTLESTFRFDLSNLADGVLSLLSYLVRPRFKPIFHHP